MKVRQISYWIRLYGVCLIDQNLPWIVKISLPWLSPSLRENRVLFISKGEGGGVAGVGVLYSKLNFYPL